MALPFLHERLQRFESLIESSNVALRAHSAGDPDVGALAEAFLGDTSDAYRDLGYAEAENEMLALKAQITVARQGIHPLTLERVTGRRREMERAAALRVLLLSAERLRVDCDRVRTTLTETGGRLGPIALYALKSRIVPSRAKGLTQADIDRIWHTLMADPESQAATQQVALSVASPDIQLVLGDLLESVRLAQARTKKP